MLSAYDDLVRHQNGLDCRLDAFRYNLLQLWHFVRLKDIQLATSRMWLELSYVKQPGPLTIKAVVYQYVGGAGCRIVDPEVQEKLQPVVEEFVRLLKRSGFALRWQPIKEWKWPERVAECGVFGFMLFLD